MVFSAVPLYMDPPNWQQQPGGGVDNPLLPQPLPPPPPTVGGDGGTSSVMPGLMSDRARLTKLPPPETALKCPRCDSTNTKFCYFNNYSLSQPRHFCKTCRRYWTRGGALRSVPVGGGCRRNKKIKGRRSKTSNDRQTNSCSNSAISTNSCSNDMIDHLLPPPPPQFPFLSSLHHLSEYGAVDFGFPFEGIKPPLTAAATTDIGFSDQLRVQQVQQFPFLVGMEQQAGLGLYQFQSEGLGPSNYLGEVTSEFGSKTLDSSGIAQIGAVKLEENEGLNLSRNFLGIPGNDHQYWSSGNAWTELNGIPTSSGGHLL